MTDRYKTAITNKDRFQVWLKNLNVSEEFWVRSYRLKPLSFYRAAKSLGSATFELLQAHISETSETTFGQNPMLQEGTLVAIMDSYINGNEGTQDLTPINYPENVVFLGNIRNISSDIFENNKNDRGTVSANEIGYLLKKEVVNEYYDEEGTRLFNPPSFNPTINGRIYGNHSSLVPNTFALDNFLESAEGEWIGLGTGGKIWNLSRIISCLIESSSLPINFVPPSGTYFTDYEKPKSYSNYLNKPIADALDDLLQSPLEWALDYRTSGGNYILRIYNSINQAISGSGILAPIPLPISLENKGCVNFNITESSLRADRVTVRGNQILCCGALTPWTQDSQTTIQKNWSDTLQSAYVNGSMDLSTITASTSEADLIRSNIPDVYRRFKLKEFKDVNDKTLFCVSEFPGIKVGSDQNFVPLCPNFLLQDSGTEEVLETPTANTNFTEYGNQHRTPNRLSMRWSDKLPLYADRTIYINEDITIPSDELLEPMIIVPTVNALDTTSNVFYINTVEFGKFGNPIKNKINFLMDEINLEITPAPQAYAWSADKRIFEDGKDDSEGEWATVQNSEYNPDLSEDFAPVGGKSHWSRMTFVVGLYSDQRLEISKTRKVNGVKVTDIISEYVIEDEDLNLWYIHAQTPIRVEYNQNSSEGEVIRTGIPKFTRNDLPVAKSILDSAFEWLSTTKKAAEFEFLLNNFVEGDTLDLEVGSCISTVTDVSGSGALSTYEINTAISTISYDLAKGSPRVSISTLLPKTPNFTRKITSNSIGSSSGTLASSRDYSSRVLKNRERPENINTVSVGSESFSVLPKASAPSGGNTIIIAKVLGGNSPEFVDGIKSPFTTLSLPTPSYTDNGNLQLVPFVEDFTELDLEPDYKIGDTLPVAPNGLCYLQLLRPYSLGGSAWNANLEAGLDDSADDFYCNRVYFTEEKSSIVINFTKGDFALKEDLAPNDFSLVVTDLNEVPVSPAVIITNVEAYEENKLILNLNRIIKTDEEKAFISFGEVVFKKFEDENDPNISNNIFNLPLESTVVNELADKFTVIFGINAKGTQIFTTGQLVLVDAAAVSLSDSTDAKNSRTAYNIIGPASTAQVHDHSGYAADQLGPASFNLGVI